MLGMPVYQMKHILPWDEYLKWYLYFSQKPPDVQEVQMAVFMNMVSGMMGGKNTVEDFLISGNNKKETTKSKTAFDSFAMFATDF